MKHNYTKSINFGEWTIEISPSTNYGYFEYHHYNALRDVEIHTEGGLWFENKSLVDYDGVYELPRIVIDAILALNYKVDQEFYPELTAPVDPIAELNGYSQVC